MKRLLSILKQNIFYIIFFIIAFSILYHAVNYIQDSFMCFLLAILILPVFILFITGFINENWENSILARIFNVISFSLYFFISSILPLFPILISSALTLIIPIIITTYIFFILSWLNFVVSQYAILYLTLTISFIFFYTKYGEKLFIWIYNYIFKKIEIKKVFPIPYNQKIIKWVIFTLYFLLLLTFTFINLNSDNQNSNYNIVIQSFATFLAYERMCSNNILKCITKESLFEYIRKALRAKDEEDID